MPQCPLLNRNPQPVSTFPTFQSLVTAEVVSLLCCTRISVRVMPLHSFSCVYNGWGNLAGVIEKASISQPRQILHCLSQQSRDKFSAANRQTNNAHAIYHKSLDPVFESGSFYHVNTYESLLAPLITLTCCCSQLVWSLCLKSSTFSVRRDAGEEFSLSEENDFWEGENFVQLRDSNAILASLTWKPNPTVAQRAPGCHWAFCKVCLGADTASGCG